MCTDWASKAGLLWFFALLGLPASPSGDLNLSQWHQPASLLRKQVLAEWIREELQDIPQDVISSSYKCFGFADSRDLANPAPFGKSLIDRVGLLNCLHPDLAVAHVGLHRVCANRDL